MGRGVVAGLALAALSTCLAIRPAVADPSADLKALTKTELKSVKDFVKQRLAVCTAQIAAIETGVKVNVPTPSDGLESVATIAGDCVIDVVARAVEARITVKDGGDAILAGASASVATAGFLVGDGGHVDQFMPKLNAELEKFRKALEKRLRGYVAAVAKATNGGFRQTVIVPPVRMDVAPIPNRPTISSSLEEIIYPSRLFLGIAGSNGLFPTDGKACFVGRAFVSFGAENINVYLAGPGGTFTRLNLAIEAGTGSWQTCFTNLPVGNFRIFVDQDPDHDAVAGEVSPEYSAIGVP